VVIDPYEAWCERSEELWKERAEIFTHYWIGRNFLPERHGQLCRIVIKVEKSRACLVEFEDGYRARTTIALLRKLHGTPGSRDQEE
jgi:hypothetical protein